MAQLPVVLGVVPSTCTMVKIDEHPEVFGLIFLVRANKRQGLDPLSSWGAFFRKNNLVLVGLTAEHLT